MRLCVTGGAGHQVMTQPVDGGITIGLSLSEAREDPSMISALQGTCEIVLDVPIESKVGVA